MRVSSSKGAVPIALPHSSRGQSREAVLSGDELDRADNIQAYFKQI